MDTISELKKFIMTELAVESGCAISSLSDNDDLLALGIIDSMGILKLVSFVEQKFGFKVKDEDIVPENFQDLNALKVFINSKRK